MTIFWENQQEKLLYYELVRSVPDFPKPGILFRDITPLLKDEELFPKLIIALCAPFKNKGINQVVGIEARGYLLGAPMAIELGAGFIPIRKAGKLPAATYEAHYELEYGSETMEMHEDALEPYQKVLIVDDVLATGGTMEAAIKLVHQSKASISAIAVLIELTGLNGRAKAGTNPLYSLLQY